MFSDCLFHAQREVNLVLFCAFLPNVSILYGLCTHFTSYLMKNGGAGNLISYSLQPYIHIVRIKLYVVYNEERLKILSADCKDVDLG